MWQLESWKLAGDKAKSCRQIVLIVGHQGVCYLVLDEKTLEESLMHGENSVTEAWASCCH